MVVGRADQRSDVGRQMTDKAQMTTRNQRLNIKNQNDKLKCEECQIIKFKCKIQMPNKAQMPKCQTKRGDKHRPCDAVLGLQSGSGEPHLRDLTCQGSTPVLSRD